MNAMEPHHAALSEAWPGTHWTGERVARHLARAADLGALLDGRHRDDVLWAWACIEGDREALVALERTLVDVRPNLAAVGLGPAEIDDVLGQARERLVVGRGDAPPALGRYAGRGPLGAFVRATTVRLGLDHVRARGTVLHDLARVAASIVDPEIELLKRNYAGAVSDALRAAWHDLAGEQRALLELQVVDELTVDEIGALLGVHRATAARRCAAARGVLLARVRHELKRQLGVGTSTADSVARLISDPGTWLVR